MYHVEWTQSALDELMNVWTHAEPAQRQAITTAADSLDRRLKKDPANEGESRPGDRRLTFFAPLAVTFQIEGDGVTVTVLHIRLYGKRKK